MFSIEKYSEILVVIFILFVKTIACDVVPSIPTIKLNCHRLFIERTIFVGELKKISFLTYKILL
jgi:hypothetical protein